jgi:hypothetical protein
VLDLRERTGVCQTAELVLPPAADTRDHTPAFLLEDMTGDLLALTRRDHH